MNHAVRALVTLAFGAGLAAAAQAQGTNPSGTAGATPSTPPAATTPSTSTTAPSATTPSATAPAPKAVRPARMAHKAMKARGSRNEVRQVQQQLKSDGLYRGRIDGKMGRATHMALSRFQQRNGLHRTASLDRMTVNRLLGGRTTGMGSSAPAKSMTGSSQTGAGGDNATKAPKLNRY